MAAAAVTITLAFPAITQGMQQSPPVAAIPDSAQTNSIVITGIVRDSASGVPLQGAQVGIAGSGIGSVADEDGRFRIIMPRALNKPARLTVQLIGFNTRSVKLDADSPSVELDIAVSQFMLGSSCNLSFGKTQLSPWRRLWRFLGG